MFLIFRRVRGFVDGASNHRRRHQRRRQPRSNDAEDDRRVETVDNVGVALDVVPRHEARQPVDVAEPPSAPVHVLHKRVLDGTQADHARWG